MVPWEASDTEKPAEALLCLYFALIVYLASRPPSILTSIALIPLLPIKEPAVVKLQGHESQSESYCLTSTGRNRILLRTFGKENLQHAKRRSLPFSRTTAELIDAQSPNEFHIKSTIQ